MRKMENANAKMDIIIMIREVVLKFLLHIVKKGMLLIVKNVKQNIIQMIKEVVPKFLSNFAKEEMLLIVVDVNHIII